MMFDVPRPLARFVDGTAFPVRRIYCIGRNYAAHAREMGADPDREPPFFFMKPADAFLQGEAGATLGVPYPPLTADCQPEVELVVALKSGGRDIASADALGHVCGYAVGLDVTRRDLQAAAKAAGKPWDLAKGFDASAPAGLFASAAACGHLSRGAITLAVDGLPRQSGDLAEMIWSVADLLAELSKGSALAAGDLVFTGTPAGVGPVRRGATLLACIDGLPDLSMRMV